MFGSRVRFSGTADLMMQLSNFTRIYQNGHIFATDLPIDLMFGSMCGFRMNLDFFVGGLGLHTLTAVARLPLRQLGFLVYVCFLCA